MSKATQITHATRSVTIGRDDITTVKFAFTFADGVTVYRRSRADEFMPLYTWDSRNGRKVSSVRCNAIETYLNSLPRTSITFDMGDRDNG